MEKILFKSEEPKNLKEAADILRQIADKVETGNVVLKKGNQEVNILIPPKVVVEIEAEEKFKKGQIKKSLEIEIEWIEGEGQDDMTIA